MLKWSDKLCPHGDTQGHFDGAFAGALPRMDVRYINPFVSAVQHVFKTMLDLGILVSKPTIQEKGHPGSEVAAVIGLSGAVTGAVALCFSRLVALRVASAFTGTAVSARQPTELADALGELANMVAGQAKVKLPPTGIMLSLPHVYLGEQQRRLAPPISPILLLPCDSALGRFAVEVTMVTKQFSPFAIQAAQAKDYKQPSA